MVSLAMSYLQVNSVYNDNSDLVSLVTTNLYEKKNMI